MEKGLSESQTRERVREILGKPLPWRLVPVRLSLEEFSALQKMAPEGDVKKLTKKPSQNSFKPNAHHERKPLFFTFIIVVKGVCFF